jgi:hypothetical protein
MTKVIKAIASSSATESMTADQKLAAARADFAAKKAKPVAAKPEPVQPEPVVAEPEPVQPEPVAAKPEPVQPEPVVAEPELEEGTSFIQSIFGKYPLAGTVVHLASLSVSGYGVASLAGYVAAGALLLTGSAFLSFCAMVLTAAIGLYAALKASAAVARYVATRRVPS